MITIEGTIYGLDSSDEDVKKKKSTHTSNLKPGNVNGLLSGSYLSTGTNHSNKLTPKEVQFVPK